VNAREESSRHGYVPADSSREVPRPPSVERALTRERLYFETLFDSLPGPAFVFGQDGRFVRWNRYYQKTLGYTPEQMAGTITVMQTVAPCDRENVAHAIEIVFRTGHYAVDLLVLAADGRSIPHHCVGALMEIEGTPYLAGAGVDISERKQAEAELTWKTALLDAQLDSSLDGVLIVDSHGKKILQNQRVNEMFAIPREIAENPDDAQQVQFVLNQVKDAKSFHEKVIYLYSHPSEISRDEIELKDGKVLDRYSAPVLGKDGTHFGRVWNFRDITERKQAEQRVREQAALLDQASDAIYVTGLDSTIHYWNASAERIYGWSPGETIGRLTTELLSGDDSQLGAAKVEVLRKGDWTGERQQRTKEGRSVDVLSRLTLLRDAHNQPQSILVIDTDVTEKKQMEAQLLRAQRLDSIGALAGGIAHDLNNVLAPIIIGLPLIKETASDETARHLVSLMEKSAQRGADIVRQVLTFTRGSDGQRVSLQLRHLIRDMVEIASQTFPKNIVIEDESAKEVWPVLADPTQVHQVLMNLCVNARDAMPDGGRLRLGVQNVTFEGGEGIQVPSERTGPFVRLRVADTGAGMPPEMVDRIFEPFFTTKAPGKGTGLGLSTALGIVKSHDGFIRVDSQVGRGTTIDVYVPAKQQCSRPPFLGSFTTHGQRGGGELVVVVDDEAAVRAVARRALEEFGYQVIDCGSGAEAIQAIRTSSPPIRVIVTDMMMPEMDGPTLVLGLRAIAPDIPIVGITGVADAASLGKLQQLNLRAMIAKPFTIGDLLAAVDGALGRKAVPNIP